MEVKVVVVHGRQVCVWRVREQHRRVGGEHCGCVGALEGLEGELRPHPQAAVGLRVGEDLHLGQTHTLGVNKHAHNTTQCQGLTVHWGETTGVESTQDSVRALLTFGWRHTTEYIYKY